MKKIKVGILGATGTVGQRFIELLHAHPYFEITALAASERSVGKKYNDLNTWKLDSVLPSRIEEMIVQPCSPGMDARVMFSALDSSVAGAIEIEFARAGYIVVSNAKNYRMDEDVPLLFPEVNADHTRLIEIQKRNRGFDRGYIVTNSNCAIMGFVPIVHVLHQHYGVVSVDVTTLQAISGAGYPGVPSMDILGNVIPYISGEEEKIETEPLKIWGQMLQDRIQFASIAISASVHRVPVLDGHLASVTAKLKQLPAIDDIKQKLSEFKSVPQELNLPLAPMRPIVVIEGDDRPQPRRDVTLEKSMAASVGRIRYDRSGNLKFSCLVHNTVRGAAGGAVLNAELLHAKGLLE